MCERERVQKSVWQKKATKTLDIVVPYTAIVLWVLLQDGVTCVHKRKESFMVASSSAPFLRCSTTKINEFSLIGSDHSLAYLLFAFLINLFPLLFMFFVSSRLQINYLSLLENKHFFKFTLIFIPMYDTLINFILFINIGIVKIWNISFS